MLRFLVSLLLFLSPTLGSAQIEPELYKGKVNKHREIVKNLGRVYKDWSHLFPDLNQKLIQSYLQFHDLPKIMELEALQNFGYDGKKTIYEVLAHFYKKNREEFSRSESLIFETVKEQLNWTEDLLKRSFTIKNKLTKEQIDQLKRLEHILDITDTGISRKEELNLKGMKYDGALWLEAEGDLEGAELSRFIEDHFEVLSQSPNSSGLRCLRLLQGLP